MERHPYIEGMKICNIFNPNRDCIRVIQNKLVITVSSGEVKVYIPR